MTSDAASRSEVRSRRSRRCLFLRGKDARLVAPPGTGDVGSLRIELFGGDHDLVVRAALSLVTGDDITVAKVAEAGRYELSLAGL